MITQSAAANGMDASSAALHFAAAASDASFLHVAMTRRNEIPKCQSLVCGYVDKSLWIFSSREGALFSTLFPPPMDSASVAMLGFSVGMVESWFGEFYGEAEVHQISDQPRVDEVFSAIARRHAWLTRDVLTGPTPVALRLEPRKLTWVRATLSGVQQVQLVRDPLPGWAVVDTIHKGATAPASPPVVTV